MRGLWLQNPSRAAEYKAIGVKFLQPDRPRA